MSVDGRISGSSSQAFAFSVFDMLSFGTHKFLGQPEVDDEDPMGVSSGP